MCPICGAPASEFTEVEPDEETGDDTKPAVAESGESRTVSDCMIETMVNWGVTHVFGMVGHSNLGLADAIRRQCETGRLNFVGVRHEGAAAFAASAFGKLTGRPAACLSIAGPGATNLLTGLWDARMDRIPILALTGQIDTQVLGPGAFQEIDLVSAFSSVAAWSQTVLPSTYSAMLPGGPEGRLPSLEISPPAEAVDAALQRVKRAEKPVIIVGHGARFRMPGILELARRLSCPVITTFKGKGMISDEDPLACGVQGRSGTLVAAHFMNGADLLLVFGASFSQHTGINPAIPTIQVDFDPITLGKFHSVTVPVYGEIGMTTRILLDRLPEAGPWIDRREEIAQKWNEWREEKKRRAAKRGGNGMNSAEIFSALSTRIPDNAVIAVDVGHNTYSFGRYFECKKQSILMSGYLGSIGFGYPAAMGAWAAAPDRPIVALTGDGGFGQYMGELCTAVKYGMNITHVLLNNRELGKISKEQETQNLPVWETDLHNPDFARYAEICGARGFRVTQFSELDEAMSAATAFEGPALVEIVSDPALI